MESSKVDIEEAITVLLKELENGHKKALLELGRRIIPTLTPEDLLQPNDYEELENHPEFRYQEGILCGIQTTITAFRALLKDRQV